MENKNSIMSPQDLAREKAFEDFLLNLDSIIDENNNYLESVESEPISGNIKEAESVSKNLPGYTKISSDPDIFSRNKDTSKENGSNLSIEEEIVDLEAEKIDNDELVPESEKVALVSEVVKPVISSDIAEELTEDVNDDKLFKRFGMLIVIVVVLVLGIVGVLSL